MAAKKTIQLWNNATGTKPGQLKKSHCGLLLGELVK
jgi:hypothetical protein